MYKRQILAHPFRFSFPQIKTDVIEVINGRSFPAQNKKATKYAMEKKLPVSAGSDAHFLWEAGVAYTILNAENVDEAIHEIMKGNVKVEGRETIWHPMKCQIYAFGAFVRRGFKRV